MLYCAKCGTVCEDSRAKCPNCKSAKLRPAEDADMVLLHRADQYTAGLLCEKFDEVGIVYETKPISTGSFSYLYDSEAMPTDKVLFVRYADLPAAKELSRQVREQVERERAPEGEEEFEEMPSKKRIAVQIVSALAFILAVIAVVLGADALANWLKSLFGM